MKTFASLVLACALLACAQPHPTPADAGPRADVAAPSPPSPTVGARPHRSPQRPHHPVVAPPKPDPRTPAQLAQAACQAADGSWRCPKLARRTILAASSASPVLPSSWSIPHWYLDPANASGCASDANSGTSQTCAGGIGPLSTYGELSVHRWGCLGNANECPRLRQNTTLTFLSSQSGNSDPIYFRPALENSAMPIIQCQLTQSAAGTLGTVTARNISGGTLLKTTFTVTSGAIAANQLIVNSTHTSRAWTYSNNAGTWSMSQPMAPYASGTSDPDTEVNTWANGDSFTAYNPTSINLVDAEPVIADFNPSTFGNLLFVQQCNVLDPGGVGDDPLFVNQYVSIVESSVQRYVRMQSPTPSDADTDLANDTLIGGILSAGPPSVDSTKASFVTPQHVVAGILGGSGAFASNVSAGILYSDIIIAPSQVPLTTAGIIGDAYVDTGEVVEVFGPQQVQDRYWGPGIVNVIGSGRLYYPSGSGEAALVFQNTGGLQLNGQTLGCVAKPSSSTITCNTTVSATNLDTNLGAT